MSVYVRRATCSEVLLRYRSLPTRYLAAYWGLAFKPIRALCKVELNNGVEGFGEGLVSEVAARRVLGSDATEALAADDLGLGLQMALFDAVGKARDVPVHALLGEKRRDAVSLAWWAPPMPATDLAAEAREAESRGYRWVKLKGRPWFDLDRQIAELSRAAGSLKVAIDFNSWLYEPDFAEPYLQRLRRHQAFSLLEEPIPSGDLSGNRRLRSQVGLPLLLHINVLPFDLAVAGEVCDGFVVHGEPAVVINDAYVCEAANRSFMLQMVGTDLTATFALHLAAVLPETPWPVVTQHEVFAQRLGKPAISVKDGYAKVPEGPGLGIDVDRDVVERYRVDPAELEAAEPPKHLIAIRWPNGSSSYYPSIRDAQVDFEIGLLPRFLGGVWSEEVLDDGSQDWADLHRRTSRGGIHIGSVPR